MSDSPPTPTTGHYIVGIGASAGGLDAIEKFFDQLPLDSGASFVLVQHLSPDFKSLMDELLARHTKLPIRRVEHGMEVEPNNVYLIPRKKNMVLSGGRLLLRDQDQRVGPNLPIDLFFQSLAQEAGERAIGVVLSGTGSDGSRGVRDIHNAGGMVVVQDPETAAFDGMPKAALATGSADLVLPPDAMPAKIVQYMHHPVRISRDKVRPDIKAGDEIAGVFAMLRRHYGIDFTLYKPTTLARRLERRMTLQNTTSLQEYVCQLETDPSELDSLYRDLLVEVTQFFRDKDAFEVIRSQVLPGLFQQANPEDGLRVWVPGCATGEEAYSLAMLLHDYAITNHQLIDIKVFATDVHRTSLEIASNGAYDAGSMTEIPAPFLQRYFVQKRHQFVVNQELRKLVIFAPHNLTKDPPFTKLDLISCRNVLIYLQPATQRKAMTLFHFGLRTGGVLFLGPSESVGDLEDEFEAIERHWKIFRKRRDVRLHGAPGMTTVQPLSEQALTLRHRMTGLTRSDHQPPEVYDALLARFVPPSLLLNEQHELVHTFGDARKYLHIPEGRATTDVLKMVDQSIRIPLTSALHRAQREQTAVVYSGLRFAQGEREMLLKLSVTPLPQKKTQTISFLVSFEEETVARLEPAPAQSFDLQDEAAERIANLERELMHTREHLQSTIEELETSNEELQSTNEELVASNEELQSTNEELHSVNEELYTVNAEHQRKIEELIQLTNDMDNFLACTEIGTIFLDNELNIRKFTPAIGKIFNLLPHDVGRPLNHISNNLLIENDKLIELIAQMQQDETPVEQEVEGPNNRAFLMRILPYRKQQSPSSGTVLTFVDVTAVKQAQRELGLSRLRLEAALDAGAMGTWEWNIARNTVHIGTHLARMLRMSPEAFDGKFDSFLELVYGEDRAPYLAALERSLKQKHPFSFEHRMVLADQRVVTLMSHGDIYLDASGQPARVLGVSIDVSSRRRIEETLRKTEEQLRAIMENSSAVIYAKDLRGRYTLANRRFLELFGGPQQNVEGKTDFDLFPPALAQVLQANDEKAAAATTVVESEETLPHPDGAHTYLVARFPLRDSSGKVDAIAAVATDISDRKRAERDSQEALARRDQFLAMLSHELRNPLSALQIAVSMLDRAEADPNLEHEAREVIRRQTLQMARLLDDLLDVSRIAQNRIRLHKETHDLNEIAREAARVVQTTMDGGALNLHVHLAGEPLWIYGDSARLQQMLINLLTNAAKYTPRGGEVRLTTAAEQDQIVIRVKDTGVGIRPGMLDKIFEMFVQADDTLDRSSGGMGVGLTLVRTIATLHGGEARAFSDGPGCGSEFVVRLPRSRRGQAPAHHDSQPSRATPCRIVIVEDNPDSRRMLQSLLKLDGYDVHAAADGNEGLKAILHMRPRIALVDIGLPGIDGFQVARKTRASLGPDEVRLVALTGYGREEDRRAALEAGFDEHLVKPLKPGQLNEVLSRLRAADEHSHA